MNDPVSVPLSQFETVLVKDPDCVLVTVAVRHSEEVPVGLCVAQLLDDTEAVAQSDARLPVPEAVLKAVADPAPPLLALPVREAQPETEGEAVVEGDPDARAVAVAVVQPDRLRDPVPLRLGDTVPDRLRLSVALEVGLGVGEGGWVGVRIAVKLGDMLALGEALGL